MSLPHLQLIFVFCRPCIVNEPDDGLGKGIETAAVIRSAEDVRPNIKEDANDDVGTAVAEKQNVEKEATRAQLITYKIVSN